jgi:hypothetical protein
LKESLLKGREYRKNIFSKGEEILDESDPYFSNILF